MNIHEYRLDLINLYLDEVLPGYVVLGVEPTSFKTWVYWRPHEKANATKVNDARARVNELMCAIPPESHKGSVVYSHAPTEN